MALIIETSLGTFVVDLFVEERPKCCLNFLKLCKMKYYNNNLFHFVQKRLVAQSGDRSLTGRGGESIFGILFGEQAKYFDAEKRPKISHSIPGLISMVNNGENQHGSQFFITLSESLDYLDNQHTVFGKISEGIEIIEKFNEAYCDKEGRPFRNIRIHHTIIIDDPFDDPPGFESPELSPAYVPNIQFGEDAGPPRLEEDEELIEDVNLSPSRAAEIKEAQEAKTQAQLLTLVGDLPSADVKPPENVLFVCRLNPVTTSEDLEIIFSRFGEILSCEVIRDKRTGSSLQYAFIEFESDEQCEAAYLKMDNIVIDDRRIHVDFSQSVAKEWIKYKFSGKTNGNYVPKSFSKQRHVVDPQVTSSRNAFRRSHTNFEDKDRREANKATHPEFNERKSHKRSRSRSKEDKLDEIRHHRKHQTIDHPTPLSTTPATPFTETQSESVLNLKKAKELLLIQKMALLLSESESETSSNSASSGESSGENEKKRTQHRDKNKKSKKKDKKKKEKQQKDKNTDKPRKHRHKSKKDRKSKREKSSNMD